MQTDLLNVALGFIEGFALIASPCILPILPLILAGSLSGSKRRPLGIIVGFVITFSLFTLFSRKLVKFSGIDLNLIRHLSYGLLLLFGVILLSSHLTEKFSHLTRRLSNYGARLSVANDSQAGFNSGLLFGCLVALIWTPCAGPILAAIIVQTVIQRTDLMSVLAVLAFAAGAAGPMFLIALFGRKLMSTFGIFKFHLNALRKILGAVIILSVGCMIYAEIQISPVFAASSSTRPVAASSLVNGLATPYPAPPIEGIFTWLNSPPLVISQLKGKVILIDFWTYSCINCKRTLPYLIDWYKKYQDKGLVIIGIHTPEFAFEKDVANVKAAVAEYGIRYPIAVDNQFITWQNYNNRYWPAHYLIDQQGAVVYTHFGEGDYDITENNIRFLLGLSKRLTSPPAAPENFSFLETPETYLGYARATGFANPETVVKNQVAQYHFPSALAKDSWALQGPWTIQADGILADGKEAVLKIHFAARHVYLVMGSTTDQPIPVKLLLNGNPVLAEKGKNVSNSILIVKQNTLYEAIQLPHFDQGILEVIPEAAGLKVYTFTFGN